MALRERGAKIRLEETDQARVDWVGVSPAECRQSPAKYRQSIVRVWLVAVMVGIGASSATAGLDRLPIRTSPIPLTTDGVPHVQIGVEPVPELTAELLARVAGITGVEVRDTVISLPGARGFWLSEDISLAKPDAIVGGREFAHIHPDGSLHASLSPELALEAVEAGWAIHHPWANQRPGWDGFVMIYSPGTIDEMQTVFRLVVGSYNYVTGRNVAALEN